MHPNPVFRNVSDKTNLEFVRARGFGILTINAEPLPLTSHIPFVLNDENGTADAHLVRSNSIARHLAHQETPAVLLVSGPDAYVSPDWYGAEDQVPTWNYVAVRLSGVLSARPAEELRDHLDQLSDCFEQRLAPKPVWRADKVEPEALARMMRMIVPVRFRVTAIDATWKLAQNKDEPHRRGAAEALAELGQGALSDLMITLPE